MPSDKLPPIQEESFDGEKEKTEVKFNKCRHKFKLISSTQIECEKCRCGFTGPNVHLLYEASK